MNSTTAPTLSVCIPTYNYGRFLTDSVTSVLQQSYHDLELIIVDNCSDDDTARICEGFRARDQRVRYVRNPVNLGMVGNWNRCLELARGEYVKILCADDILEPECLARSVALLEQHQDVVLVTGKRLLVSEDLQPLMERSYSDTTMIVPGRRAARNCLMRGNLIGEPSAVTFRRSAVNGEFDQSLKQLIDYDMWLRILEQGDLGSISETVCRFRQHGEQGTAGNIQSQAFITEELWLYRHYSGRCTGMNLFHHVIARLTLTFRIYKLGYERNPDYVREILNREVGTAYFHAVHWATSMKKRICSKKQGTIQR